MSSVNKEVNFLDWGLLDYQEAWDRQEELFNATVALKTRNRTEQLALQTPNYLVFCEHPHVYTLGKSGSPENLLLDELGLREKQATYYKINRGGDITYHGPGQIVGYPILDLDNFFTDIHLYLRTLEEAVILTLVDYGIEAGRYPGYTGVWLDADNERARKICAMGVRCSRWVTMHGFAFNVNADLDYFRHIVPCGIDDKDVTSMQRELGRQLDMEEVKIRLRGHIASLFHMRLVDTETKGQTQGGRLNYLALGDSYTIGEAVASGKNFPSQFADLMADTKWQISEPRIIATTGWTTSELQEAIDAAQLVSGYDIVTLLIGVNNQYRGEDLESYRKEFRVLLERALSLAGGKKSGVYVISIPDWGLTPFARESGRDLDEISTEIDAFNAVNRQETQDLGLSYIDITPDSRLAKSDLSLLAPDGLHPSEKMYAAWAGKLASVVLTALRSAQ